MADNAKFWTKSGESPEGPFVIKDLIAREGFSPETPVWLDGEKPEDAKPALEHPELAVLFPPPPKPEETETLEAAPVPGEMLHAHVPEAFPYKEKTSHQKFTRRLKSAIQGTDIHLKRHAEDLFNMQLKLSSQLEHIQHIEERVRDTLKHLDAIQEQDSPDLLDPNYKAQPPGVPAAASALQQEMLDTMREIHDTLSRKSEQPPPAPNVNPGPTIIQPPAPVITTPTAPAPAPDRSPLMFLAMFGMTVGLMAVMMLFNQWQISQISRQYAGTPSMATPLQELAQTLLPTLARAPRAAAPVTVKPQAQTLPRKRAAAVVAPEFMEMSAKSTILEISAEGIEQEISGYTTNHPHIEGLTFIALLDDIKDPRLYLKRLRPPEEQPLGAHLIASYELTNSMGVYEADGKIKFRVDVSELPSGAGSTFLAHRDSNGNWTKLRSTFRGKSQQYLQFEAEFTQLGFFAILHN